jgi:hypothetical protein
MEQSRVAGYWHLKLENRIRGCRLAYIRENLEAGNKGHVAVRTAMQEASQSIVDRCWPSGLQWKNGR